MLLCFHTTDMQSFQGTVRLSPRGHMLVDAHDDGQLPAWLGYPGTPWRFPFARIENGIEVPVLAKNLSALDRAWAGEAPATLTRLPGSRKQLVVESGNEASARSDHDVRGARQRHLRADQAAASWPAPTPATCRTCARPSARPSPIRASPSYTC